MPHDPDPARVAELDALYGARRVAELAAASRLLPGSDRVPFGGDSSARVVLVKGLPGPAEESGSPALAGPDGVAAARALEALGLGESYFALLSRPVPDCSDASVRAHLRAVVEAVDPEFVVALDGVAAQDVAGALGLEQPTYGKAYAVVGRTFAAVDGLEASLSDPGRKKRVWAQFKVLTSRGPLW